MCDVPSIAVFCSESIEWFPGIVSKFFFKLLVTIPGAHIITGTIVHFRFHIRCISIHKLLYFNLFSAYYYYYYYYYTICMSLVTGLLLLLLYDMDVPCHRPIIIIIIVIIICMFRATLCSSSGGRIVLIQHLV